MKIKEPTLSVFRHPWYQGYFHVCENGDIEDIFGDDSKVCILLGDNGYINDMIIPNERVSSYKTRTEIPTYTMYVKVLELLTSADDIMMPFSRYKVINENFTKWQYQLENYDLIRKSIKKTECYKEELIAKTWHPCRHIDWCLSIDEVQEFKQDGLF